MLFYLNTSVDLKWNDDQSEHLAFILPFSTKSFLFQGMENRFASSHSFTVCRQMKQIKNVGMTSTAPPPKHLDRIISIILNLI